MSAIKQFILISYCAFCLAACNANTTVPAGPTSSATDSPAKPAESAPEIDTFTFDEIDIRGCGMSLWSPGRDPRSDGVYLFNGIEPPNGASEGTMRMKVDSRIVKFQRTVGEGEEYYGQFNHQVFKSLDGDLTVTVDTEVTATAEPEEVRSVEGTLTLVGSNGQETSVKVTGDAGC
ncbi:hypothetical protein [Thermoleptolyngbya sp. C42_A2020_037]|uniref:hypothetical protein n=1 Tax=Thermoleptolyngbya sp. C42_A2020_037 TaxID=2747799 RepID=UPI001A0F02FC|nr:hypothetical protein [Thermoleptolyngbya sp. C42_A2020_037]MBF2085276.1 hypothetical protein [Thermoleptolyngbya sp. C42_A2020_037]